ncbi:hypothetical protein D5272_12760 [bacterium D16-76]|nr:hypothetical protein [bacterium D16-76]
MKAIEIAQRLAQLNETESALQAYKLALQGETDSTTKMEAAAYILQFGRDDDYKISYTMFHDLYNQGIFKENILEIMDEAFYAPNVKMMKAHYKKNCALLEKYPYIFRKDFLKFEDLPIKFYPYDDTSYTPYYPVQERFGAYIDFKDTVIKHYFFKDLENPILATDIYSQYELEYLRDNVRRSEDVAKENHIYLHYTSWAEFCAYLPCLNMKPLLEEKKIVFLFEDEINQYPIDFKERFNIDYSKFTLQPVRVQEVNKMIWHTQLSSHNGGDFFNEVFDFHPNLLTMPSIMMDNIENQIGIVRDTLTKIPTLQKAFEVFGANKGWSHQIIEELYHMKGRTDKDILVAMFLSDTRACAGLDASSRIAPTLFFQPHFSNIVYELGVDSANRAVLNAKHSEKIHNSPIFQKFKYIKTFTPMRRFTTSHGATVRFMYNRAVWSNEHDETAKSIVSDAISERVLNRSFMIDPADRLYHDSILVRFEDGKLNPKATFTALAEFVDLPFADSFSYCSEFGKINPTYNYAIGFDTSSVFKTYDEYVNNDEKKYIEFLLRDAYEYYGYDFQAYNGELVSEDTMQKWVGNFTTVDKYIRETWEAVFGAVKLTDAAGDVEEIVEKAAQKIMVEDVLNRFYLNRLENGKKLLGGLEFINEEGQLLRMMPKLELDPALLEQTLYH